MDRLARNVYLLTFPRILSGGEGGEEGEAAAMRVKEVTEAWEQLRLAADCGHVVAAQHLVGGYGDDQGEAGAAGGGSQKQARPAHNTCNTDCRT